jgi:biotin carboxyl carrier protein
VVTLSTFTTGALERSMTTTGTLFYKDAEQISLNDTFEVTEVFIEKGMTVSAEQALFSVDVSAKELEKSALELEILRLDNSLAALAQDTASTPETLEMREKEYIIQRDIALIRMEKLSASYPADGIVRAKNAGIVDRVLIEPGDRVQAGELCVETHPADAKLYVRYSLSADDAGTYQSPDDIKISIQTLFEDVETGRESPSSETLSASIEEYAYSEESNRFELISSVSAPQGRPILSAGAVINLTTGMRSLYMYIIPAYCVRTDSEGEYVFSLMQRDSLFGIENYVLRMDATVLARSDMYVAVESLIGNQVVATSTQTLSSNDVVAVR